MFIKFVAENGQVVYVQIAKLSDKSQYFLNIAHKRISGTFKAKRHSCPLSKAVVGNKSRKPPILLLYVQLPIPWGGVTNRYLTSFTNSVH